jgi:hypothetical protein
MAKKNKRRPPKQQLIGSVVATDAADAASFTGSAAWRPMLGSNPKAAPLIHRLLEVYRRRYQNGDRVALLQALDICLRCYQNPPDWVANKLLYAMAEWFSYRAATLDEAFGVRRVSKHIAQRREREDLRPYIVAAVTQLVQPPKRGKPRKPLNTGVFVRVAEEIKKSPSYVSTVYYGDESADLRKVFGGFRIRRRPRENSMK